MLARVFAFLYRNRMESLKGIPGPSPSFPAGTMGDFVGRWIWEACADYGQKYGGISLAWFTGTPVVILNDPTSIGQVLDTDAGSYYKDAPTDAVAPVISPADMFIANGAQWQFLRSSSPLNPDVDTEWLTSQVPPIRTVVKNAVDRLAGRTVDDLIEPIREMTFEAISRAIWGRSFNEEVYADFLKLARTGSWRMSEPPTLQKVPPLDPLFYLARERWNAVFRTEADRVAGEREHAEGNDLLHRTLRRGTPLSVEQLAEMLSSSFYFGGVFSTAATIAYTLRFLGQNTEYLTAILQELREREPLGEGFDLAALESCKQLDYAIRESLRLSPPVPLFARNVSKDGPANLGGHILPANLFIVITNWLLHHDPKHWTDPEKFQPARWANGGVERDPYGSDYFFPFGRGPRSCVGQSFALFLTKLTLAVMLSSVKLDFDPARKSENDYFFAVRHPKNLKARFIPV
jgi:cytochrome P450